MKTLFFLLLFTIVSCDKDTQTIEARYESDGATMYVVPEGIVIEYRGVMNGKLVSDTLVLDMTGDQVSAIMFWPQPYDLKFKLK